MLPAEGPGFDHPCLHIFAFGASITEDVSRRFFLSGCLTLLIHGLNLRSSHTLGTLVAELYWKELVIELYLLARTLQAWVNCIGVIPSAVKAAVL